MHVAHLHFPQLRFPAREAHNLDMVLRIFSRFVPANKGPQSAPSTVYKRLRLYNLLCGNHTFVCLNRQLLTFTQSANPNAPLLDTTSLQQYVNTPRRHNDDPTCHAYTITWLVFCRDSGGESVPSLVLSPDIRWGKRRDGGCSSH